MQLFTKAFVYVAFISFLWGIAEAFFSRLNDLTILDPSSFFKFSGMCLLFAITQILQKIAEK